ncbi:MAG: transcriptional repressor LexA [Desulfobacteraceae bacterium]|nr:transcriptional repressor LexA [Desulfobacteraceae bacterium]
MRPKLTNNQEKIFAYLKAQIQKSGAAPSLRTAACDMGISHAAVAQTLKALEDKAYIKRHGKYSRTIHILEPSGELHASQRQKQIPIIGRITAGLPMYAQQEFEESILVDAAIYPGQNLFALRVQGHSMKNAGILDQDIAVCQPRQYALNAEIVVALINNEEATVKRFYLRQDHIELVPANPDFKSQKYDFDQIMIQGKVIGIIRGPEGLGVA